MIRSSTASTHNVVVLGSGSLARSVCYSLALIADRSTEVTVIARERSTVEQVCHVARVRAGLSRATIVFRARDVDLGCAERLAPVLNDTNPQVVVSCVSTQSPWERVHSPSAWTRLLDETGFGLTILFHSSLAREIGAAAAESCPDALFFNASFPDAVNPLLRGLGIPVTAGVGNVAILAAALQSALGLPDQDQLHLLAHHLHLHAPDSPADEARAWFDGLEVDVGRLLAAHRRMDRKEANYITGHTIATMIVGLLRGETISTHLPGPEGLPGGYPVAVSGAGVRLRLPTSVSLEEAVSLNKRWSLLDGVSVDDGRLRFAAQVVARMQTAMTAFPAELAVSDVASLADEVSSLRDWLRIEPP